MSKRRQKGKQNRGWFWAVFIIAAIAILGLIGGLFSVTYFTPTNTNIVQYAGSFTSQDDSWLAVLKPSPEPSLIARIGDYEVKTTITSSGCEQSTVTCEPNSCGGVKTGTDGQGCDIWTKTATRSVWTDCKTDYRTYYCDCSDGDRNRCYAPEYPTYPGWKKSSEQTSEACGGAKTSSVGCEDACWSKHEIFKEGNLIKEVPLGRNQRTVRLDDLTIDFAFKDSWVPSAYGSTPFCARVDNAYTLIVLEDAFTINLSAPNRASSRGDTNTLKVNVKNAYSADAYLALEVTLTVPTIVGDATNRTTEIVHLAYGDNDYEYQVPTTQVTDKVKVAVRGDVLLRGNQFFGVNGRCYGQASNGVSPLSACEYVKIGEVALNTYTFSVFESLPDICAAENIASGKECEEYVAGIINGLEGDLKTKLSYIDELSLERDEKLSIIAALELSIQEQKTVIQEFDLTVKEQAAYIEALGYNIDEQAELIDSLETSIKEKAALIKELSDIRSEQVVIIQKLELTVKEQGEMMDDLEFTIKEQAEYIQALDLTVQEQAGFIKELESNLEEKGRLIGQLVIETDRQAELIKEMRLSFENQATIIDGLEKTVDGDAMIISDLTSNLEEQGQIIGSLKKTVEDKAKIIEALTTKNDEQATLISAMELSLEEQGEIISELKVTVLEEAEIINTLTGKVSDQAKIISGMKLTAKEQEDLIERLQKSNADQERLVTELEAIIQQKEAESKTLKAFVWVAGIATLIIFSILIYIGVNKKKRRR